MQQADLVPPNPAPNTILGTTAYYKWRANDFLTRQDAQKHDVPSYYFTYGHKYVHRFDSDTRHQLSRKGKKWLDAAMLELQLILERKLQTDPLIEYDPNKFDRFAFQSHVNAYEKAGLFTLPLNDLRLILWTFDFKDSFADRKGRHQMVEIITRYIGFRLWKGNSYSI